LGSAWQWGGASYGNELSAWHAGEYVLMLLCTLAGTGGADGAGSRENAFARSRSCAVQVRLMMQVAVKMEALPGPRGGGVMGAPTTYTSGVRDGSGDRPHRPTATRSTWRSTHSHTFTQSGL
jgi:hypothetical protein